MSILDYIEVSFVCIIGILSFGSIFLGIYWLQWQYAPWSGRSHMTFKKWLKWVFFGHLRGG